MRSLRDSSILITGGGSGLGAATARQLAAAGARVTICGRRREPIDAIVAELGGACVAISGDVTISDDRTRFLKAALAHGGRLDGLVHAAGNMLRGDITALGEQPMLDLFHSNVVAPLVMTGAAVDELARTGGAVVFFGSVHTQRAFPGASTYAATKGALETATRVLAAELGHLGIRVNAVRPGAVFTELNQRSGWITEEEASQRLESLAPEHALGRIGQPHEIAEAVEYLLSADWVTGTVLSVDGGLSLGVTHA